MLTARNANGKRGENLACNYLKNQGFRILERNHRLGRSEIDIISRDRDILVFVEVRTRSSSTYGFPEQTISSRKEEVILQGAEEYMHRINWNGRIRFDIIAIELYPTVEIEHFQDVFG